MGEQRDRIVDLDELQADQEIYGSDGEKLGEVGGITVDLDTGEPYLEVNASLFETLFVPRSAIDYAVLGEPVRLKVPRSEAMDRFSERPNVS
jgi:hypothetical protein